MPIPSYEELMPIVLDLGQSEQRLRDTVKIVSDQFQLTDEELEETIPSGSTKLIYSRVAWAVTYLAQAGLLKRPKRGHFIITDDGRSVLATDKDKLNLKYTVPTPKPKISRE